MKSFDVMPRIGTRTSVEACAGEKNCWVELELLPYLHLRLGRGRRTEAADPFTVGQNRTVRWCADPQKRLGGYSAVQCCAVPVYDRSSVSCTLEEVWQGE